MLRRWIRLSRAWKCRPDTLARRDRPRHHFDFPKELHFPKPWSLLLLFAGPSIPLPQDPLVDACCHSGFCAHCRSLSLIVCSLSLIAVRSRSLPFALAHCRSLSLIAVRSRSLLFV